MVKTTTTTSTKQNNNKKNQAEMSQLSSEKMADDFNCSKGE
jgi:hypothetical protein